MDRGSSKCSEELGSWIEIKLLFELVPESVDEAHYSAIDVMGILPTVVEIYVKSNVSNEGSI
jgi:hypothetical protein